MEGKTVADSALVMSTLMQPNQANPKGNVHGGEIVKMMDNAAGVVAIRHACGNVVTARVDELVFHQPVFVGNLVTCHAFLTFVGRSSMEVIVSVEVEELYSESPNRCGLTAYFTMVALDTEGKPIQVPPLKLINDEERRRFEEGRRRYEINKQRKQSSTCSYSEKI